MKPKRKKVSASNKASKRPVERRPRQSEPAPVCDVFGEVLCISLKKRKDRRKSLLKHLKAVKWPFKQPTFLDAAEPMVIGQKESETTVPMIRDGFRAPITAHAVVVSHSWAARCALDAEVQRETLTLVLEDDVRFVPDFFYKFKQFINAVPENWDALALGYFTRGVAPVRVSMHVGVAPYAWGLQAYVVRQPMLGEWIRRLDRSKEAADNLFYSMRNEFNIYCPLPEPLAVQADGYSDVLGKRRKLS